VLNKLGVLFHSIGNKSKYIIPITAVFFQKK